MRPATIERAFDFPLSDMRLAEIANEMADNLERVKVLEDSFDAAKEAKKEVPALLQHVRELGHYIKTGAESKMVTCEFRYDTPEPGVKQIVRTDTGGVVDTLEMTDEELQGDLFISGSGKLSLPDPLPMRPDDEPKEPEE
jgi:hypothetical protein